MSAEEKPTLHITITSTPKQAYDFLKGLSDPEFRAELSDVSSVKQKLHEAGVEIEGDLPAEIVELPPIERIEEILRELGEPDEYGNFAYLKLGHGFLVLFFGFAMPLVASDG